MNVLLNASNLRFGGGLTVALNLLQASVSLRPNDHFYLIAPKGVGYEQFGQFRNLTLLPLPDSFHRSALSKLWYNQVIFPKWCRHFLIHKIVSLGNVAIAAKRYPQLLYIQLPHLVYPESVAWQQMDWKSFMNNSMMDQYVSYHMRYATSFAVQTEIMKSRLCHRFELNPGHVHILPNAAANNEGHLLQPYQHPAPGEPMRLLFLSKYYPHKNFECLLPLAKIIREKNLPVRISLTIDAKESPGAAKILAALADANLNDVVTTLGHVPLNKVGEVMSAHHGLFLPSIMESYSGTYVEAVKYHRLIFTSHYDFAVSLLGEAAFYFDPLKPEHILHMIMQAYDDPELVKEKLEAGKELARQMPGWEQIGRQFSELIDTFV